MKSTDKVFKCTGCNDKYIFTKIQMDAGDDKCLECKLKNRPYELLPDTMKAIPKPFCEDEGISND